ncbi:MAG: hypothetical protein HRF50_02100 [Phycisphaerae bacterium]|jgi:hypothetical protein
MSTAHAPCTAPFFALFAAGAALGTLAAETPPDAASQPYPSADAETARRLALSLRLLLGLLALFIGFLAVSLLAVRLLRRHAARLGGARERTAYVDAWRRYRVTPDEIQRATSEPGAGDSTGPPPSGGRPPS